MHVGVALEWSLLPASKRHRKTAAQQGTRTNSVALSRSEHAAHALGPRPRRPANGIQVGASGVAGGATLPTGRAMLRQPGDSHRAERRTRSKNAVAVSRSDLGIRAHEQRAFPMELGWTGSDLSRCGGNEGPPLPSTCGLPRRRAHLGARSRTNRTGSGSERRAAEHRIADPSARSPLASPRTNRESHECASRRFHAGVFLSAMPRVVPARIRRSPEATGRATNELRVP